MANGEQPPVRDDSNQSLRLTAGMLRILNRQVRVYVSCIVRLEANLATFPHRDGMSTV